MTNILSTDSQTGFDIYKMLIWLYFYVTVCATTEQLKRSPRDLIGQNRLRNNLSIFLDRESNQSIKQQTDTPSIERQLAQRFIESYNKGQMDMKQAQSFLKTMHTARRPHGKRRNGRRGFFMKRRQNYWKAMLQ